EGQEQELARERRTECARSTAIEPEEQPERDGDRAQDEERVEDAAIGQQRVQQMAEHVGGSLVVTDYVLEGQLRFIRAARLFRMPTSPGALRPASRRRPARRERLTHLR